jgi:hypothetical protein
MTRAHRLTTTVTFAVVLATVVATGVFDLTASATASSKARKITIDAFVNDKGNGSSLVTGAIGDHGTVRPVTKAGKPNQDGDYERVKLQNGSFTLNESAVLNRLVPSSGGDSTCTGHVSARGQAPIVKGTGAYAHMTGTLTNSITIAYQLPRYKSGASAGQCDVRTNKPLAYFATVTGTGSVTLG